MDSGDSDSAGSLDSFIVASDEEEERRPKAKKAKKGGGDADYVSRRLPAGGEPPAVLAYESCDEEEGAGAEAVPEFVIGDASQPAKFLARPPRASQDTTAVILHCVDATGRWGSGGMFTALNNL